MTATYEIACVLDTRESNHTIEEAIRLSYLGSKLDMTTFLLRDHGSNGQKHITVRTKDQSESAMQLRNAINSLGGPLISRDSLTVTSMAPIRSDVPPMIKMEKTTPSSQLEGLAEMTKSFPKGAFSCTVGGNLVFNFDTTLADILVNTVK